MFNSLRQHLISKACVLFSNSAVKVQGSQAYRNMEMTRERISFTFDPRDKLLSLQIEMGFSFVRAAVAYAILERTSGLEPSSELAIFNLKGGNNFFEASLRNVVLSNLVKTLRKSKFSSSIVDPTGWDENDNNCFCTSVKCTDSPFINFLFQITCLKYW